MPARSRGHRTHKLEPGRVLVPLKVIAYVELACRALQIGIETDSVWMDRT